MGDLEVQKPKVLLANSTDIASLCKQIVVSTSTKIGDKKHVQVEGWQAIAVANNAVLCASDAKREYDNDGKLIGYSAKGFVKDKATGNIISTGEGFVGFDEKDKHGNATWKDRPEYAGRAMAQTRAMSRAGKSAYSFIVTLMNAGLSTTPAEEVPENGFPEKEINPVVTVTSEDEKALIGKPLTKEDKDLFWADKKNHVEWYQKYPNLEAFKTQDGTYVYQPKGYYQSLKGRS